MKEKIDYFESNLDMAGLINSKNVSLCDDFTSDERQDLKRRLEEYMQSHSKEMLIVDMKKFYLQIKGVDEAGHLLYLLR